MGQTEWRGLLARRQLLTAVPPLRGKTLPHEYLVCSQMLGADPPRAAAARCDLSVGCSFGAYPENWRRQPNQASEDLE